MWISVLRPSSSVLSLSMCDLGKGEMGRWGSSTLLQGVFDILRHKHVEETLHAPGPLPTPLKTLKHFPFKAVGPPKKSNASSFQRMKN